MSRSWLDRLLPAAWQPRVIMYLHPQHISWSRQGAGFKHTQFAHGRLDIEHDGRDIAPLLARLPQAMQEAGVEKTRVEIVLASDFMRYAIVPNPDGATNREELAMLCRHAFQRVHGDIVTEWDIQLSLATLGGNGLASAVDQALLMALRQQVAEVKGKLVSVQPALAHAFQYAAKSPNDGIFALRESGRLCLLAWQDRSWAAVRQQPITDDWQSALEAGVRSLRLQLDMVDEPPVQVCELAGDVMQPRMMSWQPQVNWTMAGVGA